MVSSVGLAQRASQRNFPVATRRTDVKFSTRSVRWGPAL